ncbi:MAG TPA: hypothetical protein VGJ87_16540, partial [Roseiflexaceae bacterium]
MQFGYGIGQWQAAQGGHGSLAQGCQRGRVFPPDANIPSGSDPHPHHGGYRPQGPDPFNQRGRRLPDRSQALAARPTAPPLIKRALESRELARRHRYLSRELKFADAVLRNQNQHMAKLLQSSYEFDMLVFASNGMVDVCNLARKAATTDLPVLILGERLLEAGVGIEP